MGLGFTNDRPDDRSRPGISADESAARNRLFRDILAQYRDSQYVPYVLAARGAVAGDEQLREVRDALDRFPSSRVAELLHVIAWNATAASCGLRGAAHQQTCERSWAAIEHSRRPTTRILVGGSAAVQ